jgi:hypothetical protein
MERGELDMPFVHLVSIIQNDKIFKSRFESKKEIKRFFNNLYTIADDPGIGKEVKSAIWLYRNGG